MEPKNLIEDDEVVYVVEGQDDYSFGDFVVAYLRLVSFISLLGFGFYLVLVINQKFFKGRDTVNDDATMPEKEDIVEKVRKVYDLKMTQFHEQKVPIKSLWIYPIRGVKGIKC